MKRLVNVKTANGSYPIIIGKGFISEAGHLLKKITKRLLIVSNERVFKLFSEQLIGSLDREGIIYDFILLEEGEQHKDINSLKTIWDKAAEIKLERKDAIVALGGGVVGDIAGFAAASYLRGINFVQIPTTLLAQVDSSVGGKTAINIEAGKNLVGAFYQPKFVLIDINTLKTLDNREFKSGLAEVLKYAFIEKSCLMDENIEFLDYLEKNRDKILALDEAILAELIAHCCNLKASVVKKDEKEKSLRAILNFGHTIAHGIEKVAGYGTFTHGEAVAMGMIGVFELAKKMELCSTSYIKRAIELIKSYGLTYKLPKTIKPIDIFEAMQSDKKIIAGKLRFVLPIDNGRVEIFDTIEKELVLKVI